MTLPNFYLAGSPKCGTSSLHHYLRQHPEVFLSEIKEPHYLMLEIGPDGSEAGLDPDFPYKGTHMPVKTMADYLALFDDVSGQKVIGESSIFYIYSPVALKRIRELTPDAKLLFAFRDPVTRAFSNYLHAIRQGRERRPVEEALVEGTNYLEFGLYDRYLEPWYDAFDPAQIKVVLFDDLNANTPMVFQDICRYLEISDTFVPDFTIRMKGGKPKNPALVTLLIKVKRLPGLRGQFRKLPPSAYRTWRGVTAKYLYEEDPVFPEEVKQRLREYYRDDVTALEQRLGRDLSAWKQ